MFSLDVKSLTIPHCPLTSKFYSKCALLIKHLKLFVFRSISLVFGIVTIASGLLGVVSGSVMGQKLRVQFPSAGTVDFFHLQRINLIALTFFIDAIICGVGMICSAPFFYGLLVLSLGPIYAIYILAFLALWFINLNWALVGDILLVITKDFYIPKALF